MKFFWLSFSLIIFYLCTSSTVFSVELTVAKHVYVTDYESGRVLFSKSAEDP